MSPIIWALLIALLFLWPGRQFQFFVILPDNFDSSSFGKDKWSEIVQADPV